jgi:membrane protein required for colicin V production
MLIDIVFLIFMIIAIVKGYKEGLIVAVFSFVAIVIGLVAAMKLSVYVADRLREQTNISPSTLPFLSFALVMMGVMMLVRLGAAALQKVTEMVFLGWANKLAGIVLYVVIYIVILSVVLFYVEKGFPPSKNTIEASQTYDFIKPWGPKVIDGIGNVIPLFQDMFSSLTDFFDTATTPAPTPASQVTQ